MSVAAATSSSLMAYPAFSWGPIKMQVMDVPIVSGNTSATATADRLSLVDYAIFVAGGITQTSAPSYSGNVATFTFSDPVATVKCQVILFGK